MVVVVGLIAGGIWCLLRSTPAKEVKRLRDKIDKLVFSDKHEDWKSVISTQEIDGKNLENVEVRLELARTASDEILGIVPKSQYDLSIRARLEEIASHRKFP